MDPSYFNALLGMSNDYYYLEDYPSAIQAYKKCLESTLNNGQVH
jgi:Tfp pilus assembly protein PilF